MTTFHTKLKELYALNCLALPIFDLYEYTDLFHYAIVNRLACYGEPYYEDIESLAKMSVIADVLQESDTDTE